MVKRFINKNLFPLSLIITFICSMLFGLFYALFKSKLVDRTLSDYYEGTSVLNFYVTGVSEEPSYFNYFLIVFIISMFFFFLISFILSYFYKEKYFKVFNLFGCLNIILIIGLILSLIFINLNIILGFIFLILSFGLYLFVLYKAIELFNLGKSKKIISLGVFSLLIMIILFILKFFV